MDFNYFFFTTFQPQFICSHFNPDYPQIQSPLNTNVLQKTPTNNDERQNKPDNFAIQSSQFPQEKTNYKNKNSKRSKEIEQEEEFRPKDKDHKQKKRCPQNDNRNVVPNIMHQVISFLFKKKRSSNLVLKILSIYGKSGYSLKRFYTYLLLIKNHINKYVNGKCFSLFQQIQDPECFIYEREEQQCYIKVCRILIDYFFRQEYDIINLTSKKMRSDKKIDHLRAKRKLQRELRGEKI